MTRTDYSSPLFTFALVSDTHIRPAASDDSSPWRVNEYANGRARHLVALLNAHAPAFVLHLGDMVHPLPSLSSYDDAIGEAKRIFAALEPPMSLIPGNHDVGDKPMPGLPAAPTQATDIEQFRRHFGADWQYFDHGGCRFVMLNAELINSGLSHEAEQRTWLEALLDEPFAGRILVFLHYPPFILASDEPSNYDNLDEPGRGWLLDLLARARVAAVFSGHVHNFFYNRVGDTDCYVLPAISFVRQDYAELFRAIPGDEYGRNDADKLGFFLIDVYAERIVPRLVRTGGAEAEANGSAGAMVPAAASGPVAIAPLGVHLRHDWREVVSLPYAGPMDEFLRKRARNDYHLLGLIETGIRRVRIPLRDLMSEDFASRVADLHALGFSFTVFHFGRLDPWVVAGLEACAEHIDAFEYVISWCDRRQAVADLAAVRARLSMPVILTRVESSADRDIAGSTFSHYVSYGFNRESLADIEELWRETGGDAVDAYAFTLGWDSTLGDDIAHLAERVARLDSRLVVNVRLAAENPAQAIESDQQIANRVAEAILAAHAMPDVQLFMDTFVDHDRGYFPRHGLYDRRLNPRTAADVFAHFNRLLARREIAFLRTRDEPGARVCRFEHSGQPKALVMRWPDTNISIEYSGLLPEAKELVELCSGEVRAIDDTLTIPLSGPVLLR